MSFCNLCGGSKKIILLLKQNNVVPYERTYDCPECPKNHDIGEHKEAISVPNGNFEDLQVQQTVDRFLLEEKRISKSDIQRQLVDELARSRYFVSKIRFTEEEDYVNMGRIFRATITVANPDEVKKNKPTSNGVSYYGSSGDFVTLDRGVMPYKESRNIPSYTNEAMPMSQEDFDKGIENLMNYSVYSKYMRHGT